MTRVSVRGRSVSPSADPYCRLQRHHRAGGGPASGRPPPGPGGTWGPGAALSAVSAPLSAKAPLRMLHGRERSVVLRIASTRGETLHGSQPHVVATLSQPRA